jgi:hypothetical protein
MQQATIEARVKVLSKSGSANYEVLVGMQDGSNSKWLDLFPDHILLNNTNSTYDVDMTEYHILRMVRDEADIRIYVDDEEVISESHVGAGESWIGFIFGAGCTSCTSEQYWDYLVFTTEGGFSPEELPSYASTLEPELARDPSPASEAHDVPHDVSLSWTPGKFAVKHDVYLGTSSVDVNTAESDTLVSQGQADAVFAPDSILEFGQTYYWRVDEINGPPDNTIFKGDLWRFVVEPFSIPVETITAMASSSHADNMNPENTVNGTGLNELDQHSTEGTEMWLSGMGDAAPSIQYDFDKVITSTSMTTTAAESSLPGEDGLGHNGSEELEGCDVLPSSGNGGGSIVGNATAPFAEMTIVNGAGSTQSLPFSYDNAFGQSEAMLRLEGQDWTASGVQTLAIAFYGTAGNTGTLYVKINNTKVVYDGDTADITQEQWQQWNIDLTLLNGLQNVTTLTIGVDGASAAGMLYIDDIRLYP